MDKSMKQGKPILTEMFQPDRTFSDKICEHCGEIIPNKAYYEQYKGDNYHIECIWDKLINKKDSSAYDDAKEFFLSLQKFIGNWPSYGYDVESEYLSDLVLVKYNSTLMK